MIRVLITIIYVLCALGVSAETSIAGMFPIKDCGRVIFNFNVGWRFHLGDIDGAAATDYNDTDWQLVSVPHTVKLMPSEASGSRNYQGVAWYRKHFVIPSEFRDKKISLHFEGIMGKQQLYVNGEKVCDHLGGYTPVTLDLSALGIAAGDTCLIAVMTDNSDDNTFPPGKKQSALDFCYHGGIYRDVWLIGKSPISITDAVEAHRVAGGGVFLHYDNISEKSADVFINVEINNKTERASSPFVEAVIKDSLGNIVTTLKKSLSLAPGDTATAYLSTTLKSPNLWSPESPYLYKVEITVWQGGKAVDGGMVRMGIRNAEFKGSDGFWLNGKPYHQLIGGNRHQDFAYVGNALPNSQQYRDALRLRNAGMTIVRCAHYPMDPSFMDACDELGIFVIVPTPGWQYWNKDPQFAQRVHDNTRTIIRRDRNHPCVLLWEPILNETRYPGDFAIDALNITREEFPYPGRPLAVADSQSEGVMDNYDVLYDWPENIGTGTLPDDKCVFTREFGEMVDDWYAHNCINRAARAWGEKPMLTAALSLCDTYGTMFHGQRQFIGGCQWHPFDHQRGYHPDPYYGGIYDAFRQKKYAFEMFRSQVTDSEPMVFIANEMTPFSDTDVTIFSNCDSVRLTAFDGDMTLTLPVIHDADGIPCAPVVFKGFWDFWKAREYSYKQRDWQRVSLLAEGIRNGEVVVSQKKMPSRRSTKIRLRADSLGVPLTADGSDFIVIVAELTDDEGNVKRLASDNIFFTVEGEGSIIGNDADIMANPRKIEWGSAPMLLQATTTPGDIIITARSYYDGIYAPEPDTLVIRSVSSTLPLCYTELLDNTSSPTVKAASAPDMNVQKMTEEERRRTLEEVNQQQAEFGVN